MYWRREGWRVFRVKRRIFIPNRCFNFFLSLFLYIFSLLKSFLLCVYVCASFNFHTSWCICLYSWYIVHTDCIKWEWYTSLLLPACWCPTTYYFTLDQIEAIQYIFNIYKERERKIVRDREMGEGKERKEQQITKQELKKNFNFSMKISIHEVFNAFPAADIAFPPHSLSLTLPYYILIIFPIHFSYPQWSSIVLQTFT